MKKTIFFGIILIVALELNAQDQTINGTTFKENGNVGMGTSEPIEQLDVNGNLKFSDADSKIYWSWPYRKIEEYSPDEKSRIMRFMNSMNDSHGNPDGGFDFVDHLGTSVLRIWDYKVGIGTTNPDMKLTVKGSIHAEEVKIDLAVPAPDYVFNKDYNLRSITELERYINKHGHLPEIPSAEDFEQKGVMLAEMNMNLLKKIEELTLYIIAQQKQLESQNKDVRKLKNSNDTLKLILERLDKIEKRFEKNSK